MKNVMTFIRARLREPGTMRSLVIVLFGIRFGVDAATLIDALTALGLVALGAWSALTPDTKPDTVLPILGERHE